MSCILYRWYRRRFFLYVSIFIHAQSWKESTKAWRCAVSEPKAWFRPWFTMALLWHLEESKGNKNDFNAANFHILSQNSALPQRGFTLWTWGGISSSELSSGRVSWCLSADGVSSAQPPIGTRAVLTTLTPTPRESGTQKDCFVSVLTHTDLYIIYSLGQQPWFLHIILHEKIQFI